MSNNANDFQRGFKVRSESVTDGQAHFDEAGDYSAGDFVGGVIRFPNVFRAYGTEALLTGISVINKNADNTEHNHPDLRLIFFNVVPSSSGDQASGAPYVMHADDADDQEGTIYITDADDGWSQGTAAPDTSISTVDKSNLGWIVASPLSSATRHLYARLVTDSAITNLENGDLVIKLQGFH